MIELPGEASVGKLVRACQGKRLTNRELTA